jgi:hypothetical protein
MTDSPINSSTTPLYSLTVSTSDDYFEKKATETRCRGGWLVISSGLVACVTLATLLAGTSVSRSCCGWGGMFIATAVVAIMYFGVCACLCSKCIPCCPLREVAIASGSVPVLAFHLRLSHWHGDFN